MKPCKVCGATGEDKPMIFRGDDWCSDTHRKVISGEIPATLGEAQLMDRGVFNMLKNSGKLDHLRGF